MNRRLWLSRTTLALFIIFLLFYFGHQLYTILNNPIKTVNALYITVDDTISTEGYFVRNEQVVGGVSGIVQFTVGDGEKVAKDAEIAEVFNDSAAASVSRELRELAERIKSIEDAKNQSIDKLDAGKIDSLITMQVEDLSEITETGMVSKAYEPIRQLKSLVMRRSMADQGGVFDENALADLKTQREKLKGQISGRTKSIKSGFSGYFSRTVDGFENVLKPENLGTLTVKAVQDLGNTPKSADTKNALGKVIDGFTWYFAAVVTEREADTLKVGQTVRLRFSQGPANDVPASVKSVKKDTAGKALVVLQSSFIDEEIVSMRYQQVDIVKDSYKGVKVPKEAVRISGGKEGVYVVSGSQAVFKEIKRIFETESFYVVKADGVDEKDLFIHDEIIVSAKDLKDKKVIK